MLHRHCGKAGSAPCQQDVYRDEGPPVSRKTITSFGPDGAKGTHLASSVGSHSALQSYFRGARREVAQEAMLLYKRCAVHHIVPFGQFIEQFRYLLRGVLQIVVHSNDNGVSC